MSALTAHLETGLTTVCRCWTITRRDGVRHGFTDHDVALSFDGTSFLPGAGLTAKALEQGTGLSTDNSEAVGVLSDAAISDLDIEQGRFDGAEVCCWLVNWQNASERVIQFRGQIGDIRRAGGAFHAEMRGLSDRLNQPKGRVFQRGCAAVLGDGACRVDLTTSANCADVVVQEVENAQVFTFADLSAYEDRWFERGTLILVTGAGEGLEGLIKHDRLRGDQRVIELWEPIRAEVQSGDALRLEAGCDKRAETCRLKFGNFENFRGFPHIPGEDWLLSVPRGSGDDGGSLIQ